ncbi:MAG: hypothetical protein II875_01920 [Clostridia bacterium]|nr:hypothetical protein [Clostridia bacterium]
MKKLTVLMLCAALLCALFAACAEETPVVYVTISDGSLVLAECPIALSDADADGALTINDALYLAHEFAYDGGAEAGYLSAYGDWGLSLAKLWGVENGGSYGYYVNDTMSYGLTDPVTNGDRVYAYVYTDLVGWSDAYSFFDQAAVSAGNVTLKLSMVTFDENFMPVSVPVEGAVIVIDGEKTEFVTDAEGNVSFNLPDGAKLISAVSDSLNLVPPVCVVE